MKAGKSKQYLLLDGKPVLFYTLALFEQSSVIDEIVVVLSRADRDLAEELIFSPYSFKKISSRVDGGKERRDSVFNGLQAVDQKCDYVVVHDGCRPFATDKMIEESVIAAQKFGGAIIALPLRDTLKQEKKDCFIDSTIPREGLWQAQTPQTFRFPLLLQAYQRALEKDLSVTDDSMLVEQMGFPVKLIPGSPLNIKITLPEDLILAEMISNHRKVSRT